jgi:translation elongation factor Ts
MNHRTEQQPDNVWWEIDLLGDIDPAVRLRSAVELGRRQAAEAASALVERLGLEREFFIRETLTWAVLRIADDAIPYLHQALSSTRWLARVQSVHVLSKMGRYEDADRLVPLVRDEVDAVAARAYWAAAQTHNPSVVPALVGQLSRGDSEHRNSLTVAVAEFGVAAVPALVDALRGGPSADIRCHAADTLSLMGSPGADRSALPLAEALGDPDGRVRLAALNAIGQLRLPFADLTVDRATGSDEPILRHLAVRLAQGRTTNDTTISEGSTMTHEGSTMTITTTDVKRLRGQTGAGVMRCKAALEETLGDFDKAAVLLRSAAAETAAKRADRVPAEGMIAAAPEVLIELNCETDFVAKGPTFRALGQQIANLAAANSEADVDGLLRVQLDDGTLADAIAGLSSASGEKVEIGRIARLPGRTTVYLHTTAVGLPPRIGAMVAFDGGPGAEELAHRVALQVTASSPQYLTRDDVPADVLAAVHTEAEQLARAKGKAEAIAARIVAGRVERFVNDTALLEQVSVVDPGRTVKDLLFGTGVHITGFARLEVGFGRR